jgi:hypothetical protein
VPRAIFFIIGSCVLLLIGLAFFGPKQPQPQTNRTTRPPETSASSLPSSTGSPTRSVPRPAPTSATAHPGETVIVGGVNPWICGSSKEALDEALKWSGLNDRAEMVRTLARTRSTLLEPGRLVKIIDSSGFLIQVRKVRLLYQDKLSAMLPPNKECWVASEALTH